MLNIPSMLTSLKEFHSTFGLDIGTSLDNRKCRNLRLNLIEEELRELEEHIIQYNEAVGAYDNTEAEKLMRKIADDLGDIAYVVVGTVVSFKEFEFIEDIQRRMSIDIDIKQLYIGYAGIYHTLITKDSEKASFFLTGVLHICSIMAKQFSLNLQSIFDAIHKSNMSKLWYYKDIQPFNSFEEQGWKEEVVHKNGIPTSYYIVRRISDGKIIKSPSYSPFIFNPETMMIKSN